MALTQHRMSEALQQWQQQASFFTFRAQQIAYWQSAEYSADKPILLLIHGFPSASWDWHLIWPVLAPHFQLIAADMPGFGFSSKNPDAEYSIMHQADMYQALLQELGISHYHLLAHDYGDSVAQELLARDSSLQQIQSAVLLNGGLFPETHRALLAQKLLLSPLGFIAGRLTSFSLFRRSFQRICTQPLSQTQLTDLWALLRHNQGQRVLHKLIHYMNERKQQRQRWLQALKQCQAPLCLINGSEDPVSGRHMIDRFRQLVATPGSGQYPIVELPGIGHYPQLEAPQPVAQAALDFLLSNSIEKTAASDSEVT